MKAKFLLPLALLTSALAIGKQTIEDTGPRRACTDGAMTGRLLNH